MPAKTVELFMFGQKEHRSATVELADADDCAFCQFVHENIQMHEGSVAFVCRGETEIRRIECQHMLFGAMPMLLCTAITADDVRSELMLASAQRGGWRGKQGLHVVVRRADGSFVDPVGGKRRR